MSRIPTPAENPEGFHVRYIVEKADGRPTDKGAQYLVLRLDGGGSDKKHSLACQYAALSYCDAIEEHLPQVARELRERVVKAMTVGASRLLCTSCQGATGKMDFRPGGHPVFVPCDKCGGTGWGDNTNEDFGLAPDGKDV